MTFKKVLFLLLFSLLGLQLFFQNSEGLVLKIFELRQLYIIEKTDFQSTFIFSKKEYSSLKDKKEIIVNNTYYDIKKVIFHKNTVELFVIEDKNESIFKFISHSLKSEKSKKDKVENKRNFTLALHIKDENKNNFFKNNIVFENFYTRQNKCLRVIIPLLKPPIV